MKLNDNLKQNPVEHGPIEHGRVSVPGARYRERVAAQDRLLSRIEVAQQFGISKRFLELAGANNDGPPFVRIGRSVSLPLAMTGSPFTGSLARIFTS